MTRGSLSTGGRYVWSLLKIYLNINFKFILQKSGEKSKNHSKDSENVADSGIIPFLDITTHFNPGIN